MGQQTAVSGYWACAVSWMVAKGHLSGLHCKKESKIPGSGNVKNLPMHSILDSS